MAPPTPKRTPNAQTPATQDTSTTYKWNHTQAAALQFLRALKLNDNYLSAVPHLITLVTRGYVSEKGLYIVESYTHINAIQKYPDMQHTLEAPSPAGMFTADTDDANNAARMEIAGRTIPVDLPKKSDDSAPTDAEKLDATVKAATRSFLIRPHRIAEIDRAGAMELLNRCENPVS